MIYQIPRLGDEDRHVLALIDDQRNLLKHHLAQAPHRWLGFLRRNTFARALQGSNSIEGYNATLDEAAAIVDDARPETVAEETVKALIGYRTAMTYILRLHNDPYFTLNTQFIRSLHFMMLSHDLTKLPGQWRQGPIYVVNEPSKEVVYEGPDYALVPALADELMAQLNDGRALDPLVKGAMAHLNLTMIHPFKDGNGRMARALQTLVIARDGILSPEFSSIEEWLGRNSEDYYAILAAVGQGKWNPHHDALPWVRFCLKAHYQQAATLIRRNNEIGQAWQRAQSLVTQHRLPQRMELALVDAIFGFRVRSSRYKTEHDISEFVASRDLKKLCDLGFLEPVGDKRGRYYVAAEPLKTIRAEITRNRPKIPDPYDIIATGGQMSLPGVDQS